jgi:hypothetical protein
MTIANGADDMGRTTIQVSDELADELHDRKDRGESYEDVIWGLMGEGATRSSDSDPQGEGGGSTPADRRGESGETHTARDEAEHRLRQLDLSGSGSKYELRIEAILSFYDYLRENEGERVTKRELENFADETDLDPGYSSFTSLWSNWVKKNEDQGRAQNTLTELPGVKMDGDEYIYEGVDNQ